MPSHLRALIYPESPMVMAHIILDHWLHAGIITTALFVVQQLDQVRLELTSFYHSLSSLPLSILVPK